MVAIYVYQLNIWLLFESIWLNSMFISHEGIVCLYLHTKLHPGGKYSKPRSWQPVESSSSRTYFNLKSNIVPASMPLSRKRVNLANGLFKVDCKHTMEFFFLFLCFVFSFVFLWKGKFKKKKKNPWNLHFSFKLRKGASVQSSLRCMVNCLQWLLCVALCFPRLMKCLTNTCLKMI